jgi:hypothetical protein
MYNTNPTKAIRIVIRNIILKFDKNYDEEYPFVETLEGIELLYMSFLTFNPFIYFLFNSPVRDDGT